MSASQTRILVSSSNSETKWWSSLQNKITKKFNPYLISAILTVFLVASFHWSYWTLHPLHFNVPILHEIFRNYSNPQAENSLHLSSSPTTRLCNLEHLEIVWIVNVVQKFPSRIGKKYVKWFSIWKCVVCRPWCITWIPSHYWDTVHSSQFSKDWKMNCWLNAAIAHR